jgi:hypothetical protein
MWPLMVFYTANTTSKWFFSTMKSQMTRKLSCKLNVVLSSSHSNGYVPVWIHMWRTLKRKHLWMNRLPHTSHYNVFSSCNAYENSYHDKLICHLSLLNDFSPECMFLLWSLREHPCQIRLLHTSHLNDCCPIWVLNWFLRQFERTFKRTITSLTLRCLLENVLTCDAKSYL